jgi:hypothetical protein
MNANLPSAYRSGVSPRTGDAARVVARSPKASHRENAERVAGCKIGFRLADSPGYIVILPSLDRDVTELLKDILIFIKNAVITCWHKTLAT